MLNTRKPIAVLAAAGLLALGGITFDARAQEAAEPAEGEPAEAETSSSQETEVNEDNYRRFMELRDQQVQRPSQPYAVLAPPGNLEKMDKLPEESQKHLRNELRGIILEGERWTPAEAGKEYPFVASSEAEQDARLRNMEAEAWSELVENYHAREAEIYAAGARAKTATADPVAGTGQSPAAEAGNERGQTARAGGNSASTGESTSASSPAPRQAGVTQSALDYLQGTQTAGGASSNAAQQQEGPQQEGPQQEGQRQEGAQQNAAEQLTQEMAQQGSPQDSTDSANADSGADSQAQAQAQAQSQAQAQAQEQSQTEAEQSANMSANASQSAESPDQESDASETREEVIYRSEGVIAIRDLGKLKGVGEEKKKDEPKKEEGEEDGG